LAVNQPTNDLQTNHLPTNSAISILAQQEGIPRPIRQEQKPAGPLVFGVGQDPRRLSISKEAFQ
jgi:hypothetical protein